MLCSHAITSEGFSFFAIFLLVCEVCFCEKETKEKKHKIADKTGLGL